MSDNEEIQNEVSPVVQGIAGPKILIAVVIVLLHLSVTFGIHLFGSTNMQNLVGLGLAPLGSALLLMIWWMSSGGVPMRDRTIGVALFGTCVIGVAALHGGNGVYLMVVALPILTTLIIFKLLVTAAKPWPARRRMVLVGMSLWAIVFALVRVDAVGGDLIPVVAWKWSPPMEQEFLAESGNKSTPPAEPLVLPAELSEDDWSGFRGADRNSHAVGEMFDTDWKANPPEELWRHKIGLGWSSFTVIGDYIFTQEQRGEGEFVVCYNASSGEEIWTNHVPARFEEAMGSGPRATPTYADGKLYTQGATGVLQCLDASTGGVIWERNVGDDTGARLPQWGFSSSPLLVDGKIVVFTGANDGKSVVAYDSATGDVAWTAGDGSHGYCSGQMANFGDVPQILMISNFGIQSFVPKTGEQLWEHEWDMGTYARVVQPILPGDNTVIVGCSFGYGSRRLAISKSEDSWKVEEVWTTKKLRPYFNDVVSHEGYLYGYDGNRVACVDLETGSSQWKTRRFGGQVLLLPEMDILLSLTEKGDVVLLEASPEKLNEVARMKALSGKTWNHPVVAGGRLYVRNSKEVACYQLPEAS